MQKKIIALAVAGLMSGAAFAQSNVTIYGVVDAAYVHASSGNSAATDSTFNGINSGTLAGSRIGFKGEEALGKGMKTVWTVEYATDIDANFGLGASASGLATRQAFVGLDFAGIGTFTLGRQYAPGFYASVRNDIMAASASAAPLNLMSQRAGTTIYAGTAGRISNSMNYKSPTFSGFTAQAMYGFGEASGAAASAGTNGIFGLGLNYANGPINVDVVYHNRPHQNAAVAVTGAAASNDNISEWMLAGTYDFKVAKLYATWQSQNDHNGTSAQQADNRVWSLGLTVPVFGNGTIHAGYSRLDWRSTGADESDAWGFGYTHALSKRTSLYTTYTHVDNDNGARQAAGNAAVRSLNESHNIFTMGISHSF